MKRILIAILMTIIISGCGGVAIHEDVNEQVAKDSMQVMDRVLYNVNKDIALEDVSDDDFKLFERFTDKYVDQTDVVVTELDLVDDHINTMAVGSLIHYAKGASLESDKEEIKEDYDLMIKFIKTGKAAGE